jgi:glycosyltransferase involved in cell wall biosynthesis
MTERSLKIAFLTTEYPTEGFTGGIGSYVRQMAHSLLDLGHSVCVLLHVPSGEGLSSDGPIPIHKFRVSGFVSGLPWPLGRGASLAFARTLARLTKELDIDVLEAPEWLGLTAFLSLLKPEKLRVVVRLHTCSSIIRSTNKSLPASLRERIDYYRRDWAERRSILTADTVTAVSKAIGGETKRALRLPNADFQVVPNSVNTSGFSLADVKPRTDTPVVLFVGRLEWRKGPDVLIRAIPAVLERRPDVLFRFAGLDTRTAPGNTPMKSYLENVLPQAARSSVEFSGHLAPAQLEEVLRHATVCVFPSRYEGLPMVCLEAMARGKAIVTTDLPGFCELISDGETGMIVRSEDSQALASALLKLIADEMLRGQLGKAAQETARTHFHATVVAKSMLNVYYQVMNGARVRKRDGSLKGEDPR